MNEVTLYKRNAQGKIVVWNINELSDGTLSISHGVFAHKHITEFITPTKKKVNELQSRVNAKRKEGYKSIEDLYDNSPENESVLSNAHRKDEFESSNLYNYLQTYLPKYSTTTEGFVLPMLAKTLEDNKPFEKYGPMLGQWKINGVRCLVGAIKQDDMFNPIKLTYHSREGTDWTHLFGWMDEKILNNITKDLIEMMVEEGVHLDGELYLPNYSVNDINSFVKNPDLPQHYKLQYWCYDIAMEDTSADKRTKILLSNTLANTKTRIYDATSHKYQEKQFVILPTIEIDNIVEATRFRDNFIKIGFEGLIVRNKGAEYAFGKRNQSMFKFKRKEDGLFEVVKIVADKRGLPIYTLKNDINDELFDCTINIPQDRQRTHLEIKDMLVGKKALVEYRERSGKKQVPFHAKIVRIYV